MRNQGVRCSTGLVRQAPLGEKHPDLELIPTCVKVPRWLKRWVDRQPESFAILVVQALRGYCGAEPPAEVREILDGVDHNKIAAAAERLSKVPGGRFIPE